MTGQDNWWFNAAHLSIVSSIFVVIYICSHALSTIARMPHPLWRTIKNAAVEVQKKPIQLSYIFKLQDDKTQTSNCVTFHLKTNRPAEIKLYWGVGVSYLFNLMRCSWTDFRTAIANTPAPLNGHVDTCHSVVDCPFEQSADGTFDGVITVRSPSNLNWVDLKNKYRYPLAIVIYHPDVKHENITDSVQAGGNEIHGLFVLLHVKSDTFQNNSSVLASYIKMDNGNTFLLKPLYLADDDGLTVDESDASPVSQPPSETLSGGLGSTTAAALDSFPNVVCCVCQTLPVSRAILPCGHVSLCAQCFQKMDKCPICRGEMQYYFRTRDEDYIIPENDVHDMPRRSWFDFFEEWNDRINNWLGFH